MTALQILLLFFERIKLVRQIAERHTNDGDDDVGNGRPPLENLNKKFQAEIVDEDVADGHKEIPDNLCPAFQRRARKTDMSCHPKAREEGDRKLEHEGCDMRRESNEAKVEHLRMKHIVIKNVIQHPFQSQIHATTSRITEQLQAHEFAEGRIEKVDDRGQGAFYPGFYVFEG